VQNGERLHSFDRLRLADQALAPPVDDGEVCTMTRWRSEQRPWSIMGTLKVCLKASCLFIGVGLSSSRHFFPGFATRVVGAMSYRIDGARHLTFGLTTAADVHINRWSWSGYEYRSGTQWRMLLSRYVSLRRR